MNRIQSIDIFRGLTIFVMVFVNDVAGVSGLPDWMYHAAADADAMTYVDIVFPAFLIIVGMSIPLAMQRRQEKGESLHKTFQHVAIRTTGLIVLGVFMVNAEEMNVQANLIPKSWWNILFYLSAIAIWNQYPRDPGSKKNLFRLLQFIGIVTLVILAFLYRKGEPDSLTGMTTSWWGILGLIGWAYLISTIIYFISKGSLSFLIAIFCLLLFISLGLNDPDLQQLRWLKAQSGHLVHSSLTVSGIILTILLQKGTSNNGMANSIKLILMFAGFSFLAGYFLRPVIGLSKIYATPTWALYSIGWSCLVFAAVHWLVEIKGIKDWAGFLKPAGTNPLLTYILPFIYYAIVGFGFWPAILNQGIAGVLRSIVFSLLILWIANLLTKKGVRLRL